MDSSFEKKSYSKSLWGLLAPSSHSSLCFIAITFLFPQGVVKAKPITPSLASEVGIHPDQIPGESGKSPLYISRAGSGSGLANSNSAKAEIGKLNDVVEENKLLKDHREVLLQYTKELRDKYQKLQQFCLKSGDAACSLAKSDASGKEEESKKESIRVTSEPQNLFKEELSAVRAELEALKLKKDHLEQEINKKIIAHEELNKKYAEAEGVIAGLRVEVDTLNKSNKALSEGNSKVLSELQSSLERKDAEAKECFMQLETSQELITKIPDFERDILALKNDLLLRKSAEEILMPVALSVSSARTGENAAPAKSLREASRSAGMSAVAKQSDAKAKRSAIGLEPASDVTIIEVTGKKVSLRAGPGTNNSSLMDIQAGARLLVEAKEGAWYRVTAPTGGRAYIHSSYVKVVQKGTGDNVSATSPPEPRRPSLPVTVGNNQDPDSASPRAAGAGVRLTPEDDMVPVNIPAKPVRRAGAGESAESLAPGSKGTTVEIEPNSTEALAIEKLMKAMENQSKGKNQEN